MSEHDQLGGTTLRDRTARAVADPVLRPRLARAVDRFGTHRTEGLAELTDPDGLRHAARAVRGSTIARLPEVLDRLADQLLHVGAHVHWAPDADDANRYLAALATRAADRPSREPGPPRVVKSKSMATEETGLNEHLAAAGCEVVETDLGEWVIQLAGETPSHIIAPAVHHDRYSIREVFRSEAGATDALTSEPTALNAFARVELRRRFLSADLGVTGANFAVAQTGSIVLVTNEGNGRMVTSLPRIHAVVLGAERAVDDWDQLDLLLALLTRSATGQRLTSYVNVVTGPRQPGERDGPEELHVVILDNGRSELLGSEFVEMLNCIRCGACLNVCPVYRQVGGHAYGWVYNGPMGAVLTPLLSRQPEAAEVANASSLCGACMDACPVEIPLQDLLLAARRRRAERADGTERLAWRAWSRAWSTPAGYEASTRALSAGRALTGIAAAFPGLDRWSAGRATPRPAARPFRDRWRKRVPAVPAPSRSSDR